MSKITFEVSALKESNNALVDHFEVKFSEPVNGQWLYESIEKALKKKAPKPKVSRAFVWKMVDDSVYILHQERYEFYKKKFIEAGLEVEK